MQAEGVQRQADIGVYHPLRRIYERRKRPRARRPVGSDMHDRLDRARVGSVHMNEIREQQPCVARRAGRAPYLCHPAGLDEVAAGC